MRRLIFLFSLLVVSATAQATPLRVSTSQIGLDERAMVLNALVDGGYVLAPLSQDPRKKGPLLEIEQASNGSRTISLFQDGSLPSSLLAKEVSEKPHPVLTDQVVLLVAMHLNSVDTQAPNTGIRLSESRADGRDAALIRGSLIQALLDKGEVVSLPKTLATKLTLCILLDDEEVTLSVGDGTRCDRKAKRFARPKGVAPRAYRLFLVQNAARLLEEFSNRLTPEAEDQRSQDRPQEVAPVVRAPSANPEGPRPGVEPRAAPTNADAMFQPDAAPLGSQPPSLGGVEAAKSIDADTFKNLLSPRGVRLSVRAGGLARPPHNDWVLSFMAQTLNNGELALLVAADVILWDEALGESTEANVFGGIGYRVGSGYGFELDAGLLIGANFFHHGELQNFGESIPQVQLAAGIQVDVNYALTESIDAVLGLRVIGSTPRGVYDGANVLAERLGTGAFVTLGFAYDLETLGWMPFMNEDPTPPSSESKRTPRAIQRP